MSDPRYEHKIIDGIEMRRSIGPWIDYQRVERALTSKDRDELMFLSDNLPSSRERFAVVDLLMTLDEATERTSR